MKALLQRVSQARVEVDGETLGAVGRGLVVLFCAEPDDREADAEAMARKIAKLRIFADKAGKMNLSLIDVGGGALAVSQFTLAADLSRGNRPGFSGAAHRSWARPSTGTSAMRWPSRASPSRPAASAPRWRFIW